jgi:hypothetical protein
MPAFLARRYAAVIDVQRRDDRPDAFTWRGRRYVVTGVLDHWWETAAWWSAIGADGDLGGVVGDDEREMWRVEARPAYGSATRVPAVVEVGFAWSTGRWTIAAVMD